MTSNRTKLLFAHVLTASLAAGAAAASAADVREADAPAPDAARAAAIVASQAGGPIATMDVPEVVRQGPGYNPIERGVRNAALPGPTAPRRYVQRTATIYHFSYWEFAKLLPKE